VVRSVVDTQRVDPSVATGVQLSKLVDQAAFDRRVWPWATSEATSNCVEHACPVPGPDGVVEVSLLVEEDVVVVAVMDHGRWRARPAQDGSRGTSLMNRITASVVIHHGCRRCKDVQCADPSSGEWRSWDGPFGFCSATPDATRVIDVAGRLARLPLSSCDRVELAAMWHVPQVRAEDVRR